MRGQTFLKSNAECDLKGLLRKERKKKKKKKKDNQSTMRHNHAKITLRLFPLVWWVHQQFVFYCQLRYRGKQACRYLTLSANERLSCRLPPLVARHILSPFLIGRMFLREPSWKYSSKLYSGSKNLRSTCSGNIRIIASDWLRAELSCKWRKNKNKNGWRCR